jgi:alkylation response protein AidB-like acyl-CoA dehydrogenase
MSADVEGAWLLAYQAAAMLDRGEVCDKEVAMAKAWCSDAYPRCCMVAHELFGAYGFTEECDLHFYTKHAKEADLMFGHSWFHRSKVADALGL